MPFDRPGPFGPPPLYARLREHRPVARVRTPNGGPAWLVTSYDAVAAVLADRRFGLTPPGDAVPGHDTLFQDGEAHARLRRLVSGAFSPRSLAALRPRVEELATGLAAGLARGAKSADLVAEFAAPLSITVIGELLGVAIGERDRFRRLVDAASGADFFFGTPDDLAAAARAYEELGAFAAALVAAKRTEPADDLLSRLIAVRDADDGRLSDAELVAMAATIVSAGYLSASNAVCAGTLRLLAEGRLAALASATPEQVAAVVEEVLRTQSGRTGEPFPRFAQEDVELAGAAIGAGDMVLVRLEAAHHDPRHFADPGRFDPDRRSDPLLVFGHGMHYCLGAPLARTELGAALTALARHLPGLRLGTPAGEIAWTSAGADSGPAALPVAWD
ncbi:cytochrome P450 [Nonomuraea muscovyensis]|uniref:cytochrome P450 n=1 Tax=Nonomuraea muscovyensis TaxID=1124761 RepID=UPI0033EAF0D5